jgi:serine phosphatase RsbU (regulator of sigma subunit)
MNRSDSVRLPDWLMQSLSKDAAFRVLTMDGLGWIDPYTGQVVAAPFGHQDVAMRHLAATKPWLSLKPKPLKDLLYTRWLTYLQGNLEFIEHLRIFKQGLWLNPYTGQWIAGVRLHDNHITAETIDDIARTLGKCEEAQSGKMLEKFRIDVLVANGPDPRLLQQQETAQYRNLKAKTDFQSVRSQFLKMLSKPPRLDNYQIVLQYEPFSAFPRSFYDFISLDRDRIMLVMGDLQGEGPGAALMVAQAMRTMRRLAAQRADLLDFFANLNDELRVDLLHGCSIGMFACVLNLPFNSLTCLNIGFHPAVLLNSQREIALQQIHTQGERLGVTSGQQFRSSLRPMSLQLQLGDIVAMFTDGVARAHNPRDINAGRMSVMGGFASHLEMPCGMMVAKVLEEAKARVDGHPTDDFCAVALRVKHPGENGSGPFPVNAPVAKPLTTSMHRR